MNYLTDFCFLCLQLNNKIENNVAQDSTMNEKMKFFLPSSVYMKTEFFNNICIVCYDTLSSVYNYQKSCIKNIDIVYEYVLKLKEIDNSNLSISLNDITQYKTHKLVVPNIETETPSSNLYEAGHGNKIENIFIKDEVIEDDEEQINEEKDVGKNDLSPDTDNKHHKCEECNKIFKNKHHLRDHIRIHTKKRPFKCEICEKNFASVSTLNRHSKTHNNDRPFQCEICSKTFKQISYLQIHMRAHSGEKLYTCDICSNSYSQRSYLEIHKRKHVNAKAFKCEICQKTFTESGGLKKHIRTHTGDKPFKCHLCNFKCANNSNLIRHIRAHLGEKHYICNLCELAFGTSSNLNRHIQLKHNKN